MVKKKSKKEKDLLERRKNVGKAAIKSAINSIAISIIVIVIVTCYNDELIKLLNSIKSGAINTIDLFMALFPLIFVVFFIVEIVKLTLKSKDA